MAYAFVKRILVIALSGALALMLAWGAAETFFRFVYPPTYVPDAGLAPDGALGWNSVPPVTPLPLNSAPYKGAPYDRQLDAAPLPSVAFVGDSFTDRKPWPAEAQRILAEHGVAVDGFNLGVSGYGTTQEVLKLEQHFRERPAQAIVVLFFAWNDLRDNYPYPELFYGPQRASRPYYLLSHGDVSLAPVRWSSWLQSGLLRSEVYLRVVNPSLRRVDAAIVRRWPDLPSSLGWRAKVYYEESAGWHPFYRRDAADSAYVAGAYETTMAAFRRMHELASSRRATLLVIGIDNAFTVDADVKDHFITPHPELDPSIPLKRIGSLLQAEGIEFIDAQPELAQLGRETGKPVYDGPRDGLAGHLQPEGYQVIGRIAARWLAERLTK
jgi:hypothetical protein